MIFIKSIPVMASFYQPERERDNANNIIGFTGLAWPPSSYQYTISCYNMQLCTLLIMGYFYSTQREVWPLGKPKLNIHSLKLTLSWICNWNCSWPTKPLWQGRSCQMSGVYFGGCHWVPGELKIRNIYLKLEKKWFGAWKSVDYYSYRKTLFTR